MKLGLESVKSGKKELGRRTAGRERESREGRADAMNTEVKGRKQGRKQGRKAQALNVPRGGTAWLARNSISFIYWPDLSMLRLSALPRQAGQNRPPVGLCSALHPATSFASAQRCIRRVRFWTPAMLMTGERV